MCQIFNSSKIVVDEAALSDGNRIFRYNITNFPEYNMMYMILYVHTVITFVHTSTLPNISKYLVNMIHINIK